MHAYIVSREETLYNERLGTGETLWYEPPAKSRRRYTEAIHESTASPAAVQPSRLGKTRSPWTRLLRQRPVLHVCSS